MVASIIYRSEELIVISWSLHYIIGGDASGIEKGYLI